MRSCAISCGILSVFALLVLPIWAFLLFCRSPSFELPDAVKIKAGAACVIAAMGYAATGAWSFYTITKQVPTPSPAVADPKLRAAQRALFSYSEGAEILEPLLNRA